MAYSLGSSNPEDSFVGWLSEIKTADQHNNKAKKFLGLGIWKK
tara:strand:+ start:661 stop:789 length:129 start_codon:yes stop_codon:yes gene_type:complete